MELRQIGILNADEMEFSFGGELWAGVVVFLERRAAALR